MTLVHTKLVFGRWFVILPMSWAMVSAGSLSMSAAPGQARPGPFAIEAGEAGRVVAAYQDVARTSDRANFDAKARAAVLGPSPDSAFAFVRDRLGNDLYPGALRGADGTLSAGSGNDVDKSLLLGALLTEGKHKIRYARCSLPVDRAQARLAALFGDAARQRPAESDIGPALRAALRRAGVTEQRTTEILAARQSRRVWLDTAIFESASTDLDLLRSTLKNGGITPSAAATDPAILAEARDHYWLQYERSGSWVDLDASDATATPGSAPCAAVATVAELPAAVFQTITIEVRNEYATDGALSSNTLLTHRVRASDVFGRVLILDNVGIGKAGGTGLLQLGSIQQYRPALQVGDTVATGTDFSVVPPGGGFADALGGGSDGPTLVAQWIDFTIEAPGRRTKVSRALVDFVDPEQRSTGKINSTPNEDVVIAAVAQGCAIAISAGRIDPVLALEAAYGATNAAAIGRLHDAKDPKAEKTLEDAAEVHQTLLGTLALSHAATAERALVAMGARGSKAVRIMRDQPMLTIANIAVRPRNNGSGFVAELSVDYRHAAVRAIADSPEHATDAFWANALNGLVNGAIEQHLPVSRAGSAEAAAVEPFTTRTAVALARSKNIELRGLAGKAAAALLRGDLAGAGGRRMVSYTTERTAFVGPIHPVEIGVEPRVGGWVLNLDSGQVVPLIDSGLHGAQSPAEYRLVDLTRALGDCLANSLIPMGRCRALYYVWRRHALTVLVNGVPEGASVVPNFWQLLILA